MASPLRFPPFQRTNVDAQSLRRAFAFLKPYRVRVVFALIALVLTSGASLAVGQGVRVLIDEGFAAGDPGTLDSALLVLIGVVAFIAAGTYLRFYLVMWIGERVVADIRSAVYANLMRLDVGFYETSRTGDVLSRITADTTTVQSAVGSSVSMALRNALMLFGGTILLFITNARLTMLALLVVPVVLVPILVTGRKVRRQSRESQDRVADIGARAEESLNAIRTVQAYTQEDAERASFDQQVEGAFGAAVRRNRTRAALISFVIFLVFGAVGLILWVGGHDVLAGRITGGELSAFVFYAIVVASAAGALSEVAGELYRAAGSIERLMELLETPSAVSVPDAAKPLPVPPLGTVTLDHVTFQYPARPDAPALHDFTLHVKAGETVALVGPSGAGKTTVFQLLLRFYDPKSGRVLIDGVDLRETDPREVRRRIGLVAQDPVIFSADAMANIRYGRPEATEDEVIQAARAAQALPFIESLPEGFATFLGEKGVRLSGGQKQRIAIARALLRDPTILLLDEATSALDAENERLVQAALERLMEGRTTLVIAHRLATVVNADRIAVMDTGRLIATGSHRELIDSNPLYAKLAELQFGAAAGLKTVS